SGGTLAKAVTDAGGLGIIGFGLRQSGADRSGIPRGGQCPRGLRLHHVVPRPSAASSCRLLDHKPAVVILSFGDARPFASAIKEAGAALISQVQTVAQAIEAVDLGSDIVVAQGTEAGGHGAARSTLALVPAVVDAVRERTDEVVVVAAGGIADGRGL